MSLRDMGVHLLLQTMLDWALLLTLPVNVTVWISLEVWLTGK